MKKVVFAAILNLLTIFAIHSQVTIKGRVVDKNDKPISGATILIKSSYEGADTDDKGEFSFQTKEKGNIELTAVSQLLYFDNTLNIDLSTADLAEPIIFKMISKTIVLDEVVVASVSSLGVAQSKIKSSLSSMDIYTNPAGNGDIGIAFQTTPGIQQSVLKEGFFVRGGDYRETSVVIDGVPVRNFFAMSNIKNVSTRARFEPGLFKGMVLGTGGYSTQYGNALSGVLELTTNDIPDYSSYSLGISPLFLSVGKGYVSKNKRFYLDGAYVLGNYKYIKPFLKRDFHFSGKNNSHNIRLRGISKIGENTEIRGLLLSNIAKMDAEQLSSEMDGSYDVYANNSNSLFSSIVLKHYLGIGLLKGYLSYNFENNKTAMTNATQHVDFDANYHEKEFKSGINYEYKKQRFVSIQGFDFDHFQQSLNLTNNTTNTYALFNDMQYTFNNHLGAGLGVRIEKSNMDKNPIYMPRASITYKYSDKSALSFDAGLYSQIPFYKYPTVIITANRERSEQYNLTYQFIDKSYVLRMQLFTKKYRDLITLSTSLNQIYNEGSGYARGVDLFFKDATTFQNFQYWISYSYIDAKRKYLYYPYLIQPTFVANHTASLVLKKWMSAINSQINATIMYNSGFPYRDKNKPIDEQYTTKTKPSFDLNLSWNYPFKYKRIVGVFVVNVSGILSSNHVFNYEYSNSLYDGKYRERKIGTPTHPLIFFGLFLSLGADNREEIINSYL